MKIIGEKLSNKDMLQVKGGASFICTCNDGSGQWIADYDDTQDMVDDINDYCYDIGNGGGGSCLAQE